MTTPYEQFVVNNSRNAVAASTLPLLGVNIHSPDIFSGYPTCSDSTYASLINALGAQIVRINIDWAVVEGSLGVYTFSGFSGFLTDIRADSIKVVIVFNGGNSLYTSGGAPPTTGTELTKWENFITACANQWYGTDIYYEIYNEPEDNWGTYVPSQFATLVNDSITALVAAKPSAQILLGGLLGGIGGVADMQTIQPLINWNGLVGANWHPYVTGTFSFIPEQFFSLGALMASILNGKPCWVTEVGETLAWVSGTTQQAYYVARTLLCAIVAGIPACIIYDCLDDNPVDPANNFGLYEWTSYACTFTSGSAEITATQSLTAGELVCFSGASLPSPFTAAATGPSASPQYFVQTSGLSGAHFEVNTTAGGTGIAGDANGSGTVYSSNQMTIKPAGTAFASIMSAISGCTTYTVSLIARHCAAIQFNKTSTAVIVAWNFAQGAQGQGDPVVTISLGSYSSASATDVLGNSVTATVASGTVQVALPNAGSPIIVTLS